MVGRAVLSFALVLAALAALDAAPSTHHRRIRHDWRHRTLVPPPARGRASIEQLWLEQRLDHLDSSNTATWRQRYFRSSDVYQPGGPAFVFIGGESDASSAWLESGFMYEQGVRHGALLLELEHRYYGESRPTADLSSENLRYLSALQALEDLAYFIRQLRAEDPQLDSAKWVVFGGSYAGNLAAWARERYPDIIDGAVASSGPVLAEANFTEYLEVVGQAINRFNPECYSEINAVSQEFEELLQSDAGVSTINDWFSLCEPLDLSKEFDVAGVSSLPSGVFAGTVQYNSVVQGSPSTVEAECRLLLSAEGDTPLQRFLNYAGFGSSWGCLDVDYEASYEDYQNTEWMSGSMMRQWLYQTCTEYGYYQTTDSPNQPFGHRLTLPYFTDGCALMFGPEFTAERVEDGVVAVNELYGGRNPDVTNVAFVNGELDPWHALSVLEDLNESSPAIIIANQSHCSDMYPTLPTDVPQLTAAREIIAGLITQWIS